MTKSVPCTSKAIANYFLDRAWQSGCSLDPMQIQKLVYIAHGWHLAMLHRPLVLEPFEAWTYGPVEPSLYSQFKRFGNGPIRNLATHRLGTPTLAPDANDTHRVLDFVWKKYGAFSGPYLARLTHNPGTPWHQTREIDKGGTISDDLIAQHYGELLRRERQSS